MEHKILLRAVHHPSFSLPTTRFLLQDLLKASSIDQPYELYINLQFPSQQHDFGTGFFNWTTLQVVHHLSLFPQNQDFCCNLTNRQMSLSTYYIPDEMFPLNILKTFKRMCCLCHSFPSCYKFLQIVKIWSQCNEGMFLYFNHFMFPILVHLP